MLKQKGSMEANKGHCRSKLSGRDYCLNSSEQSGSNTFEHPIKGVAFAKKISLDMLEQKHSKEANTSVIKNVDTANDQERD